MQQACRALVYNSLACVAVGIKGNVPDISWLYIPELSLGRANRISFPSNYSPQAAPEGCSSVLAEITYQPGDEVSAMTDAELSEQVIGMLEKMDLISRDSVIITRIWRQPFAYVVYDLEYQKNIEIIRDYCSTLGIPLVGRFAQFEYLNMDGCIRSAMDFVSTYPRNP